jgi:organic hydroperoxide reductase OsmC/OhrA
MFGKPPMNRKNVFTSNVVWTGNTGSGTQTYRGYKRSWNVEVPGKPVIQCSNDPQLGGDPTLMNPEDMLLSALSACHMLWYLHLASKAGIVVTGYRDDPIGLGETAPDGAGRFVSATLQPKITARPGADPERAEAIHHEIHKYCYIARSVAFPVRIEATFKLEN